jgi:hypothetical protein
LIEHDGPEALSTRRLGAVLGVEAMAICHHFGAATSCSTRSDIGCSNPRTASSSATMA